MSQVSKFRSYFFTLLPQLLMVFIWVGLFLLWPYNKYKDVSKKESHQVTEFCVADLSGMIKDYRLPYLLIMPSAVSFSVTNKPEIDISLDVSPSKVCLSENNKFDDSSIFENKLDYKNVRFQRRMTNNAYRQLMSPERVLFEHLVKSKRQVFFSLSDSLAERRLKIPKSIYKENLSKEFRKAEFSIILSSSGYVEHVFIDKSSGDKEFDKLIRTTLLMSKADVGDRLYGKVTVEFNP